jgi:hypothetical protein
VRIKLFFNSVSSFNVKEMRDIFLEVIKWKKVGFS